MLVYCVAVTNYNEAARNNKEEVRGGVSLALAYVHCLGYISIYNVFGKMYSLVSVFQILTKDKKKV